MTRKAGGEIDNGAATILVDRCIPPDGLGCAPSTLKAVLWCLRGLGGPGDVIRFGVGVIERRTCLTDRTVGKAIGVLRVAGIIEQLQSPAPGRPAAFKVNYAKLCDWLDPEDRGMISMPTHRDPAPNAGRSFRRTQEGDSGERRKEVPASEATPESPSPNAGISFTQRRKEVPATYIGNSCIRPAEDLQQQQQQHDAAAAAEISRGDWLGLARRSGLEIGIAGQCADALVTEAWPDPATAQIALERLSERLAGGDVRNPVGLFLAILKRPGGPEPSREAIKRATRAERAEDAKRVEYLSKLSPRMASELARRVALVVPDAGDLVADGRWRIDPTEPSRRAVRERIWRHWAEINNPEPAHA